MSNGPNWQREKATREHITEVFGRNVVPMETCLAESIEYLDGTEEFEIDGLKFTVDFNERFNPYRHYLCRVVDTRMPASDPSQTRYFAWYPTASSATPGGHIGWGGRHETYVNPRGGR